MECSDALCFLPPHLVAFAWRYHPSRLRSSLPPGPTPAGGPELSGVAAPRHRFRNGNDRASQVPEESSCAYALLYDPGGTDRPGPTALSVLPPLCPRRRLPQQKVLSRLNHTAFALAVYASRYPLPERHARLASRCWPLYGTGLVTRRTPTKGFGVASYISFLPSQACLAQGQGTFREPVAMLRLEDRLTPPGMERPTGRYPARYVRSCLAREINIVSGNFSTPACRSMFTTCAAV
jgi:hypothetical protein